MRTKKPKPAPKAKMTASAKRSMSESRSMSRELPFAGIAPGKSRRGKRKM